MKRLEKSYSYVFKKVLKTVNPLKKKIMIAECVVHKFIIAQSLVILNNDGYKEAYELMQKYLSDLIEGVVWADQDLKSSNHFYNPYKEKGLYGNSDAKTECIAYYTKSLNQYLIGDYHKSMFYLGAACHLIQDLTVPQHANVKLLKDHKSYENWVIKTHQYHDEFKLKKGGIYYNSVEEYVDYNSKEAIRIYDEYSFIKNKEERFQMITARILTMAQATTAGLMLKYYNDIKK